MESRTIPATSSLIPVTAVRVLLPLIAFALPHAAQAQRVVEITGIAQTQFNTTSVEGSRASEILIRRARIIVDIRVNDFLSGRVMPDFGNGSAALQDAYARLTFSPSLRATAGQFKRPFDIFALSSGSTRMIVADRAGAIRGVDDCAGPGGTCGYTRFTEGLMFGGRDIGAMLEGTLAQGRVRVFGAVMNGTGLNKPDENGAKSFSGRVQVSPFSNVVIAGQVGVHDYVDQTQGTDRYAPAFGGDLEIGSFARPGFHLQAGALTGKNWRNLVGGDPTTFRATQAVVSWRAPLTSAGQITGVEPLARISWADPDTATPDNGGIVCTPGLVLHFASRSMLLINLDMWFPSTGSTEWSFKLQMNAVL